MTALYRRLLGAQFDRLPGAVRSLHDVASASTWTGCADVVRGASPAAGLLATILRLPPAGADQPLTVTFTPARKPRSGAALAGRLFQSTQRAVGIELHRPSGRSRCGCGPGGRRQPELELIDALLLGWPVPRRLLPVISTRESARDGRYHFAVEATVPAFGLLVRYSGWLERAAR
jgi:hypothetical protein